MNENMPLVIAMRAVSAVLLDGEEIDAAALRGKLLAAADQHDALASELDRHGDAPGASAARHIARLGRDLLPVADHLERGQPEDARLAIERVVVELGAS